MTLTNNLMVAVAVLALLPALIAAAAADACAAGTAVTIDGKTYGTKYLVTNPAPAGSPTVKVTGTSISALVVGTLKNGSLFWNSSNPSAGPGGEFAFKYTMPVVGLIVGFDTGCFGMAQGETRQLCIPADEGYGAMGRPGIPPNSTLVFTLTPKTVTPPL